MKVKVFVSSTWCTSELERDVNRWFEKVDVDVVDIKVAGTENKVIFTVMYNDKPERTMTVEEAMIEAARASALSARSDYEPKESPKPSHCVSCSLCPADSNVCPLTGKDIDKVNLCFDKKPK